VAVDGDDDVEVWAAAEVANIKVSPTAKAASKVANFFTIFCHLFMENPTAWN